MSSRVCVDGRYAYTSASQVNAFRSCPRKWYNSWILGIQQPETDSMKLGTAIHAALEKRMKAIKEKEICVDDEETAKYVRAAMPYLPFEDFYLEQKMELETFEGGPRWVGFIDLLYEKDDHPFVLDYKTTSNMRYAKTPEELSADTQVCSYAKWAMQVSDRDRANVGHLYLQTKTKTPKVKPVEVGLSREEADIVWARDMDTVREMVRVVEELGPGDSDRSEELTPNTKSCDLYGGCFYRRKCGIKSESLVRLVAAGKKASGQTYTSDLSSKGGTNMSSLSEKLKARAQAPVVEPEAEPTFAVVPPDAPPRDKKLVDKAKAAAPALPTPKASFDLTEFKTVAEPAPKTGALSRKPLYLYVDCLPTKGSHKGAYTIFEDWISTIADSVAQAHGQPDYRMISYTSKAALSLAIKDRIQDVPEVLLISSYAAGADVALEVLIPHATSIVKAMR